MTTAPERPASYVSIAYSEIRRLILSGEIAPGSRVTVRPISDRLGLSPTPIRTALESLQRQGILEIHEHRGYFVPTLGRDDMMEIYELREAVDGIAARHAARRDDRDALVRDLTALLDRQRRLVDAGDIDQYRTLDVEFHRAIWEHSQNNRLASICDDLTGQLHLGNSISARVPGRPEASLDEHREILDAIAAADARAAERASKRHVRKARAALAKVLDDD